MPNDTSDFCQTQRDIAKTLSDLAKEADFAICRTPLISAAGLGFAFTKPGGLIGVVGLTPEEDWAVNIVSGILTDMKDLSGSPSVLCVNLNMAGYWLGRYALCVNGEDEDDLTGTLIRAFSVPSLLFSKSNHEAAALYTIGLMNLAVHVNQSSHYIRAVKKSNYVGGRVPSESDLPLLSAIMLELSY